MNNNSSDNMDCFNFNISNNNATLKCIEPLTLQNASSYDKQLKTILNDGGFEKLIADFSALEIYDSYLVVFVNVLKSICSEQAITLELAGMDKQMQNFHSVLSGRKSVPPEERPQYPFWKHFFMSIGSTFINGGKDILSFIEFFGDLVGKMLNLLIHPSDIRWKDFPYHFTQAGVNALPIGLLILFLIGFITGYQGALQLKQFGADIYIADLVGISITRELSPLMLAIIVAGRSGSAYAAEIGTMKVSEEIDALNVMGFDPMKFLVLPRVIAVMITLPLLTLFGDIAGITGGLLSALTTLDITVIGFFKELEVALNYYHVFSGVFKSFVFGFIIAAVGCFRGFQVHGGAESVGKFTTASVVTSILLIIIFDSIFTFLFQTMGI